MFRLNCELNVDILRALMSHPVSRFLGSAGQSFGCFLTPGMNIRLVGEANDYVGKVWTVLIVCIYPIQ